jgi:nucleoside-diphosphate-sugar epimerase
MGTVLITGGTGFLGSHLMRALLARGERVRIFSREPSQPNGWAREGLETTWGDIRDAAAVDRAVAGTEVVVHLVSNSRQFCTNRETHAVNVGGTEHVLAAAAQHRVAQVIHCSTIGVHGDVRQIPGDEATPFNPGDAYQATKLEAEERVREWARRSGIPATIVRPPAIIGAGDLQRLKLFQMIQRGRLLMLGSGLAYYQSVYIDDVVAGFLLCLRNPMAFNEVFVIGGDEYVSLNEWTRIIAEELGVTPRTIRLPLPPFWLAAVCEWVCVPFKVNPPLHRRRMNFFTNNRAFRVDKARRVLGFVPEVPLREAVRRTIAGYRERGWLA